VPGFIEIRVVAEEKPRHAKLALTDGPTYDANTSRTVLWRWHKKLCGSFN